MKHDMNCDLQISTVLKPSHQQFYADLCAALPLKQIYTDPLTRLAYGTDASFYRYIPEIVARAHTEDEVALIMRLAALYQIGITFRASGTSLSGQTSSDSVLVLLGDGFLAAQILNSGAQIKLKPMVIGQHANAMLAAFARKIGPDPASINTARIGGISANNSSGMCCGTQDNSYHTLDSMRVILADGAILDTSDIKSIASFRKTHHDFLINISKLRDKILSNKILEEKIRHKYRLKNTTGYGINALLDFSDPIDILIHLMIGSEGTLGFISEITFNTVPDYPHKASALVYFESLEDCCHAVTALRGANTSAVKIVDAVELLDARSIICVGAHKPGLPDFFYAPIAADAACLLIETRAEDANLLDANIKAIDKILAQNNYHAHTKFSTDIKLCDLYWSVRKGLLPIIGAARALGTNVLTEDVAIPVERLAEGVRALTQLLLDHHYHEGMIMGHALEGNLHFILTPLIDSSAEIARYSAFMEALTQLVAVDLGGSLKGEHGTGRNIAPFVEREWGLDAYDIMCQIKELFDPKRILNPEVIISKNKNLHLENIKTMPAADPLIDTCIECGFCEPACPSNGLSLTPRQRIVIWRRIQYLRGALAKTEVQIQELAYYEKHFPYQGIDTCATTGMCAQRCPVGINTGSLIKKIKQASSKNSRLLSMAEKNMHLACASSRLGLKIISIIGTKHIHKITHKLHQAFKSIPIIPESLPKSARNWQPLVDKINHGNKDNNKDNDKNNDDKQQVVYFVSCVNRVLGDHINTQESIVEHTLRLFDKAGFNAIFPKEMASLCCGQPFDSVGAKQIGERAQNRLNNALLAASKQGKYPVYLDNSPCASRIKEAQAAGLIDACLILYDSASFLKEHVINQLNIQQQDTPLVLHIPCSATKMGVSEDLIKLAQACSKNVSVPDIACCGFAGNKGFTLPELNANALRNLKNEIPKGCQHGVSMSTTCQIGLSNHAGISYQSIEALLDECSTPPKLTFIGEEL